MCFLLKCRNEAVEWYSKGWVTKVFMAGPPTCRPYEFLFLKACRCCLTDNAAQRVDCVDKEGASHHPALSGWCRPTAARRGKDGGSQRINADFFSLCLSHLMRTVRTEELITTQFINLTPSPPGSQQQASPQRTGWRTRSHSSSTRSPSSPPAGPRLIRTAHTSSGFFRVLATVFTPAEKRRTFTDQHPTVCETPLLKPHFEKHDQ